jgi:hypothetical protein
MALGTLASRLVQLEQKVAQRHNSSLNPQAFGAVGAPADAVRGAGAAGERGYDVARGAVGARDVRAQRPGLVPRGPRARPVAGDEPGEPVRYAVQLHLLMSQAEMELWLSVADRCRLEVDDVVTLRHWAA